MLGRLRQRADFERLLAVAPIVRSAHFAAHHLAVGTGTTHPAEVSEDLSTESALATDQPVDKTNPRMALGCIVPKRHARRAATRNLLRRQIRAAFLRHADALDDGQWLIRLRSGWPPGAFVSATSPAMRRTVAAELDQLFREAAR